MSFTLKDIKGAVYEHSLGCCKEEVEQCTCGADEYNEKVRLRLNREKLARNLYNNDPDVTIPQWNRLPDDYRGKWFNLADAIIAAELEIVEVEK